MGSISVLRKLLAEPLISNNRHVLILSLRRCCNNKGAKAPCPRQTKPVSVADRTINLANQPRGQENKYCVKPAMKKLVVNQPCGPCAPPPPPTRATCGAKQIKICRAQDMKRVCPVKPCACPPRKPPETFGQKLKRYCLLLIKAAIAGGIVYWTIDIGIWSDTDTTTELYQSMVCCLVNMCKMGCKDESDVKLFNIDQMIHQCKELWNHGVVLVCGSIVAAPIYVIGLAFPPKECPPDPEAESDAPPTPVVDKSNKKAPRRHDVEL